MTQPLQPAGGPRREFLKTSTAAFVGGAAALHLANVPAVHAAASDTLKIGLIGCGGRGSGAAKDTLSINKGVKLVAMADAFADRVESSHNSLSNQFADKVDVPKERRFVGFDAYKQLLATDIDLVIMATPPGFRPLHFAAAIAAGKHVFMEKPVAVDAPGVRAVLAAGEEAKKKGLGVGVGLQRRHQAGYLDTIARLQEGLIGEIVSARAYWNGGGVWVNPRKPGQTEMEYQMRNWYYFNWLCGDHIVEQHIHNLDVINWVKNGFPVKAQGMGGRQVRTGKEYGEIYDHHAVEFTYADGAKLFSYCRHIRNCWDSISEHVQGTKGICDVGGHKAFDLKGQQTWITAAKGINPYQQEHLDLIASIRSGTPLNEAETGAKSSMTSILGRLATYSGKELTWEKALNSQISLAPKSYAFDAEPPVLPDKDGFYTIATPGISEVV